MNNQYQICTRCIMDTTDPEITFDDQGVCSHCKSYENTIMSESYLSRKQPRALENLVAEIKKSGAGKNYDCIIGVSGGVDSTYVAYITKKLGLRALAVHLDNGWNSELAVSNIQKTLDKLKIDLFTYVIDWEEFRDIQLSFLKASTPDSEIPTDHAIQALLYRMAAKENVNYILIGRNTATEGGGVAAWSQGHADWRYIKCIQNKFGSKPIRSFPYYGLIRHIYYTIIKNLQCLPILDYVHYDKQEAVNILQAELAWKPYPQKHNESIYTKFYQGYILPRKFGFDKKRLHLSSLIWSGQLSREESLVQMKVSDYDEEMQQQDKEYVIKKLRITDYDFDKLMEAEPKSFSDYPSYKKILYRYKPLVALYHRIKYQ